MKKRLYRFVTSRSFANLLSVLALAALSFFALDEAYALPPVLGSGGITNTFKDSSGDTDLVCLFNDPRSTVEINYFFDGMGDPIFTMQTPQGKVVMCGEVPHGSTSPPTSLFPFTLSQVSPVDPQTNLPVTTCYLHVSFVGETGILRWEFDLKNCVTPDPLAVFEWDLQAVDPTIDICQGNNPCINRVGVPLPPNAGDFPGPPPDSNLPEGVVFRYEELLTFKGVPGLPQTFQLRPCHSGSFNASDPITCGTTDKPTRTVGNIVGQVPVQVNIQTASYNAWVVIGIFGDQTFNPPPVKTLVVNGTDVTGASIFSLVDINGDGITDVRALVRRSAFTTALKCSGIGPTPVAVTGIFTDNSTQYRGDGTVNVLHCP